MKLKKALITFLALSGGMASAASMLVGNIEVQFTDSTDAISAAAPVISLGWIDTGSADLSSAAGIQASFVNAGSFNGSYAAIPTYMGLWASTQVVFDAEGLGIVGDNAFLFAEFGNGDYALLETTTQFLSNTAIPNENSLDLAAGSIGTYTAHVGSFSTGGATGTSFQAVQGIPEPSIALLGALGVLGLVRRRR